MRLLGSASAACLVSLVVLSPKAAVACAVCAAGDASMAPREAERAASGTMGAAVDVRGGGLRVGDAIRLSEWRTEGSVYVAPKDGLRFRLAMPVLARSLSGPDAPGDLRGVPGDLHVSTDIGFDPAEGRGRGVVLTAGLGLPTAMATRDDRGEFLPSMLQPGCNSVVPEVIVSTKLASGRFSVTFAPRVRVPVPVRAAPHRGPTVSLSTTGQFQPHPRFAVRLGVTARGELEGAGADGRGDGLSGGFVGYLAPEIALRPTMDLQVTAGVFFPAVQALAGGQRELPTFVAGMGWAI